MPTQPPTTRRSACQVGCGCTGLGRSPNALGFLRRGRWACPLAWEYGRQLRRRATLLDEALQCARHQHSQAKALGKRLFSLRGHGAMPGASADPTITGLLQPASSVRQGCGRRAPRDAPSCLSTQPAAVPASWQRSTGQKAEAGLGRAAPPGVAAELSAMSPHSSLVKLI